MKINVRSDHSQFLAATSSAFAASPASGAMDDGCAVPDHADAMG